MSRIEDIHALIKLCNRITRKTQARLADSLRPWHLTSGTYPFLLALSEEEGVHAEQLSRKLGVDKAMATRSVRQLTALGYLQKRADEADSRACCLFLTETGRAAVPAVRGIIRRWIDFMTAGLAQADKRTLIRLLTEIERRAGSSHTWTKQ